MPGEGQETIGSIMAILEVQCTVAAEQILERLKMIDSKKLADGKLNRNLFCNFSVSFLFLFPPAYWW